MEEIVLNQIKFQEEWFSHVTVISCEDGTIKIKSLRELLNETYFKLHNME